MKFGTLLTLPGLALSTAAKTLAILAAVNQAIAERITGAGDHEDLTAAAQRHTPPASPAAPQPPPSRTGDAVAQPAEQPTTPRPIAGVDVEALAQQTAPEVIAALDGLSTSELADLFEYESRRRRRKSVLAAIEAATAPAADAAGDDIALDDVREPDELVYSTQTPPR